MSAASQGYTCCREKEGCVCVTAIQRLCTVQTQVLIKPHALVLALSLWIAVGARTVFGPKWTAPPLIHAPQGIVFSFLSQFVDERTHSQTHADTCMKARTSACTYTLHIHTCTPRCMWMLTYPLPPPAAIQAHPEIGRVLPHKVGNARWYVSFFRPQSAWK